MNFQDESKNRQPGTTTEMTRYLKGTRETLDHAVRLTDLRSHPEKLQLTASPSTHEE